MLQVGEPGQRERRGLNVKNALETLAGLAEWELEVAANLGIYQGFVFLGIEQVSGHSRQKDFFLC